MGADRKLSYTRELKLVAEYQQGKKLRTLEGKYKLSKIGIYGVLDRHGVARVRKKKSQAEHGTGTLPTQALAEPTDATVSRSISRGSVPGT